MTKEDKGYDQKFRALGDVHRLQILALLKERERSGGELLEQVNVVQSTLSHHMKTLLEAGLVTARRNGKRTYYTVAGRELREAAAYLEQLAAEAEAQAGEKALAESAERTELRPEAEVPAEYAEQKPGADTFDGPKAGTVCIRTGDVFAPEEKPAAKGEKKKKKSGSRGKSGKKDKKSGKRDKKKNKGKSDGKK